jgi:hypothetical protein
MKLTDKKPANTKTTSNPKTATATGSNASRFTPNQSSLNVQVPAELTGMLSVMGTDLGGLNVADPSTWTTEQINLAQKHKEKFKAALQYIPIMQDVITEYLNYKVGQAEFMAAICKQMLKSKKKIDKASADIIVAFFGYQKYAERLSQNVTRRTQLLEQKNQTLASIAEDDLTQAITYFNQLEALGTAETTRKYELKNERAKVLSDYRTERRETLNFLNVGHLSPKVGRSA